MHLHGPGGIWCRKVGVVACHVVRGPHRPTPDLHSCITQWVNSEVGGEQPGCMGLVCQPPCMTGCSMQEQRERQGWCDGSSRVLLGSAMLCPGR